MTIPLWIYRCEECGAVWCNPPGKPLSATPPGVEVTWYCRLVYYRTGDGLAPCMGNVKQFVGVLADE